MGDADTVTETPAETAPSGSGEGAAESTTDAKTAAAELLAADPEPGAEKPAAKPAEAKKPEPKVEAKPEKKDRPSAHIAEMARREKAVLETKAAAEALQAKYSPLDALMEKRDFVGVLTHLAQHHGAAFSDFVSVIESGENPPADPAKVAADAAKKATQEVLDADRKAREDKAAEDKKKDDEAKAAEATAREKQILKGIRETAEGDPDRWELASLNPVVEETDDGVPVTVAQLVWKIITKRYIETDGKEKLEEADVLDIVEKKLKAARDEKRAKAKDARKASQGRKPGDEAAGAKKSGRAAEPTLNNRNTSGPAAVDDDVDDLALSDSAAIERAARRARVAI